MSYYDLPEVCQECGTELVDGESFLCSDCELDQDYEPHCPYCGSFPHEPHEPGCYLYDDD